MSDNGKVVHINVNTDSKEAEKNKEAAPKGESGQNAERAPGETTKLDMGFLDKLRKGITPDEYRAPVMRSLLQAIESALAPQSEVVARAYSLAGEFHDSDAGAQENESAVTAGQVLEQIGKVQAREPGRVAKYVAMWLDAEMRCREAREQATENQDKWLRAAADLDNQKKRSLQERSKLLKYRNEELLRDLLPIVDNLDRALIHSDESSDSDAVLQGVQMVLDMFKDVLNRYGVTEIESKEQPFDPNVHEAMAQVPAPDVEPNTVVEEMEKGYKYQDRLLRPAKVVVSAKPQADGT